MKVGINTIRVHIESVLKDIPASDMKALPHGNGAYVIKVGSGRCYVGSSKTLRSRVREHRGSKDPSIHEPMVSVCCYRTSTHMDARILEYWLTREIGPELNGACAAGTAPPGARCKQKCEEVEPPGRDEEIHVEVVRMATDVPVEAVATLPEEPGVYVLRTSTGKRYVGFSGALRSRVRAHVENPNDPNVSEAVSSVSWYQTKSEADAAILEYALIRDLQPELNRENQPDASVWTTSSRSALLKGTGAWLRALHEELGRRIVTDVGGAEVIRKKWVTYQLSRARNFCAVKALAASLQVDLKVDERRFRDPSGASAPLQPTQAWNFNRRLLVRTPGEVNAALPLIAQAFDNLSRR